MRKLFVISMTVLMPLSIGGSAYACDMHGAGFGSFGFSTASWQAYAPTASTTDPAFNEDGFDTSFTPLPAKKTKSKPSFANIAHMAALKAKAKLDKKQELKDDDEKIEIKKTPLNADR